MSQIEITRFRTMCRQFRWLAIFMVLSVSALLVLLHLVTPLVLALRDGHAPKNWVNGLLFASPTAFYLAAIWSIGRAMGDLSEGRVVRSTLSGALRKVGLALGIGGLTSVFVVTNLARVLQGGQGGWLHFDVAGMTLGMIGGALFLLGRVMDQASRIQAELDEFV